MSTVNDNKTHPGESFPGSTHLNSAPIQEGTFNQFRDESLNTKLKIPIPSFLQKLNLYLEKHLSDENLNVSALLRFLCMSRTSLHRKLVAATGMNTTEYIRFFRLQWAAILLEEQLDLNVFEIALSVGFNHQSYFTKKFKEIFGCCPKKYRRDRTK